MHDGGVEVEGATDAAQVQRRLVRAGWLPPSSTPRAQLAVGLVGMAAGQVAMAGVAPGDSLTRLVPGLLARERQTVGAPTA